MVGTREGIIWWVQGRGMICWMPGGKIWWVQGRWIICYIPGGIIWWDDMLDARGDNMVGTREAEDIWFVPG